MRKKRIHIALIIVFLLFIMPWPCNNRKGQTLKEEALKQRAEYTLELEPDCLKAFEGDPFVRNVEVKNRFAIKEISYKDNGKKHSFLEYRDYIEVYVYVKDTFSLMSNEKTLEKLKNYRSTCGAVFSKAYSEKAPYYKECARIGEIPGEEKRIYRLAEIDLFVVCGNDTYGYPKEKYSCYFLNDVLIDFEKKGSGSGGNSSGGNTYHGNGYSGMHFDPDDYDNPDDYADDAWGIDFDDWDDAYNYWENW